MTLHVDSEVGRAAAGDPAPAGPGAEAAHADQPGRRTSSTTCCGSSTPSRSTTRSPRRCATGACRCICSTSCSPRRSRSPRPGSSSWSESFDERVYGPMALDSLHALFGAHGRRRADDVPDRRHDQARAARAGARADLGGRPGPRARRLPAAAAAQPPLHPRHLGLDLRRRLDQLDAQAGPDARDHPLRGDLPLAPALRRRRRSASGPRAPPTGRRPPRAATSWSWAAARCWSG